MTPTVADRTLKWVHFVGFDHIWPVFQTAKLPSGKCLGGTSTMNHMQYLRGSRHDYDEWAKNGAHGWAYKDVLPYFIKSEDNRNGEFVRTGM